MAACENLPVEQSGGLAVLAMAPQQCFEQVAELSVKPIESGSDAERLGRPQEYIKTLAFSAVPDKTVAEGKQATSMLNTHIQTQQRVWSKMSSGIYMASLLFSLVSGHLQGKILQLDSVVTAKEGDDVTLSCLHPTDQINKVLWYQQPIGQKPLLVTSSYYHSLPFEFHNDFDKTKRFDLSRAAGSSNLTITKVEPSDSAVYYCAGSFSNIVSFGAGTVLVLKGQDYKKYTVLQPTGPQILQPEDSVSLQCTVLTQGCSGEHSVYWFRHGSGESHPGIIYTHGNRSDECKKSSETDSPTQSCVYKLPKRNLSLSDAGTYYCAVAACGQILFGKGAELKVDEPGGESMHVTIMICLAVLLFISLTINVCLCLTCRKKGKHSNTCYNLNHEMNYAALKFNTKSTKVKRVRQQEETVYSRVTGQNQI
ncbi:uncharacterized protein LOC118826123 [Colossoma macropomum]|uniref:uncharacterized protein LOC118826123 n=1 Tax=Colossoma macropomum TaxID=42526 RepID=UPI001863BEFF|nr:uncharacterized protein LOC118826123 [Colossoma macropomum]